MCAVRLRLHLRNSKHRQTFHPPWQSLHAGPLPQASSQRPSASLDLQSPACDRAWKAPITILSASPARTPSVRTSMQGGKCHWHGACLPPKRITCQKQSHFVTPRVVLAQEISFSPDVYGVESLLFLDIDRCTPTQRTY